MSANSKLTFD